jgi:integrase
MNTIFLEEYILTRYVPYHRSKCLKNISGDLQMINRIMSYEIVKKPLNEIKKNDLITFFAELQTSRNISKSTVNRYYSRFSNIFTFALDEGDVGRNPLKGIKKFKEKYRSRCLSETEISALLKECHGSRNKELYPIVVLALNTGMRRGEILALTTNNIAIRSRKIILHGYMTKTGESREIPLNDTALEILKLKSQKMWYRFDVK